MGFVHGPEFLARLLPALKDRGVHTTVFAFLALAGALLAGCRAESGGQATLQPTAENAASEELPQADPDSLPPPVANGQPMPPAERAAGIPPYPDAIVHMRDPGPRPFHVVQAFTPVAWDSVVAFYQERLPEWEMTRAEDMVLFRKGPGDQATVSVSPWRYQDLPLDAPSVLHDARTAIGAAWR